MPSSVPGEAEEASNDAVSSGGRSSGGGGEPVPLRAEAADAPPPSNADRINRADGRVTDKSRCDFNDSKSVNKYYPPHKGKGRHNVPQTLIDQCQSDAAKKRAVEEWRILTRKQQQERKDTLNAEEKKRKADERAVKRGATKRRKAREAAEQKKQKADDRRAKETERKRKAREESKNKVSAQLPRAAACMQIYIGNSYTIRPAEDPRHALDRGARKRHQRCSSPCEEEAEEGVRARHHTEATCRQGVPKVNGEYREGLDAVR